MKSKRALMILLLLSLTACIDITDPYDRIQGEPGEDDGVAVIDAGEGGEAHGGEADEGH